MLEAERQFRKVIGCRDLAKLAAAVETLDRHSQPDHAHSDEGGRSRRNRVTVHRTAVAKFHDEWDILLAGAPTGAQRLTSLQIRIFATIFKAGEVV